MPALTGTARRWEPRRLRLRLFTAAGQLVTTGPGPTWSPPPSNGSHSYRIPIEQ